MTQEFTIVGVWSLVRFETKARNGRCSHPLGADAVGSLVYTADGYMAVSMMAAGRRRVNVATEELSLRRLNVRSLLGMLRFIRAASTFIGYSGSYVREGSTVCHDVQTSQYPDWVGTRLVRECRLVDGMLILSFVDSLASCQTMTWRRCTHAADSLRVV